MKILLTGANGQLGKELQQQFKEKNISYIKTSHQDLDIADYQQVKAAVQNENPDIIINCAAFNDVDGCETKTDLAFRVNSLGPRNLALSAQDLGAKLVHISTDYVFSGDKKKPYKEYDKASPLSIYGKSKLMGEKYVQSLHTKYFIIRTAWLFGEGNNFVKTMLNLLKNNEVINVVDDQIGTPTYTVDLAKVIIQLIQSDYYGLYHGTSEGQCSRYEFASKIFELTDDNIKLNKVSSDYFNSTAQRPHYSVLDNFMLKQYNLNLFNTWNESLYKYIKQGMIVN